MTAITCFRQRIQYVYPCFRRCVFGGIPPLFFIRFRQISVYGNTCFRKRKCVASLRKHTKTFRKQDNFMFPTRKNDGNAFRPWKTRGAIHSTKIPTVRRGKVVHLKRWTSFFKTFPVGQNLSFEFWTEISGNFGWMDRSPTSSPGRFSLALGAGPPWGRGWSLPRSPCFRRAETWPI